MPGTLEQYVVYRNPLDHPGHWVVRKWLIALGAVWSEPGAYICRSLEEARAHVPDHCVRLARAPDDDPAIYEVWI